METPWTDLTRVRIFLCSVIFLVMLNVMTFQSFPYTCCEACWWLMNYPLILGSVTWWPLYFISHDTWLVVQGLIPDYHVEPCTVNNKKKSSKDQNHVRHLEGLISVTLCSKHQSSPSNDRGFPFGKREDGRGLLQMSILYNYMRKIHL